MRKRVELTLSNFIGSYNFSNFIGSKNFKKVSTATKLRLPIFLVPQRRLEAELLSFKPKVLNISTTTI